MTEKEVKNLLMKILERNDLFSYNGGEPECESGEFTCYIGIDGDSWYVHEDIPDCETEEEMEKALVEIIRESMKDWAKDVCEHLSDIEVAQYSIR